MNCATAEAIPFETKTIYIQGSLYAGVDAQLIACMLNGGILICNDNPKRHSKFAGKRPMVLTPLRRRDTSSRIWFCLIYRCLL
jgi:hypothetical protein